MILSDSTFNKMYKILQNKTHSYCWNSICLLYLRFFGTQRTYHLLYLRPNLPRKGHCHPIYQSRVIETIDVLWWLNIYIAVFRGGGDIKSMRGESS